MADIASQQIGLGGLAASYSAANVGGDTFTPGEDVFLHVKNGGASPITVTVVTPNKVEGLDIADAGGSVPAAGERFFGTFPAQHFARSSDGKVDITYSGVTSLTLAVFKA